MKPESRRLDRIEVTFDEPMLVADAWLIVPATLMVRLGLECLLSQLVCFGWSRQRFSSGTQGADVGGRELDQHGQIDHADRVHAGAVGESCPWRVIVAVHLLLAAV